MNKTLLLIALALGMQAHALQSAAAVVDFESLSHDDDLVADAGYLYQEDGFQLANAGSFPFATFGAQISDFTGSTALINDNDEGLTVLSAASGVAFNLASIDLAELAIGETVDYSVVFTGTTLGGDIVTQAFTLDGLYGAETFAFGAEFNGLVAVSWTNSAGYHQFDNINVTAVPEPEAYAMMLAGLGLLGAVARRKRA